MKRLTTILVLTSAFIGIPPLLSAQSVDQRTRSLIDELGLEEAETAMRDMPRWKKPEKVYIDYSSYGSDEEQDTFRQSAMEVAGNVEIISVGRRLEPDVINSMEVFIGRCNPEQIKDAKNLIWLQHSAHGVDDCVSPETLNMPFVLTNAQHTSGPPIAEHVIALMMMMARGLNHFQNAQTEHDWIRRSIDFPVIEIKDKTMLVVGLGGVGTEIAERAHALGMRIFATRNSSRNGPEFIEYVGLADEVYDLAGKSDFIVNSLPLTDDTQGMFNTRLFKSFKKGGYYISIGRGETTVTDDLIAALKDGTLTAAALDVTDPEPLPPENQLWSLPNAIITPHVAANTDQGRWRRWLVVRENLRRYINGDKLLNVTDKELGY